MTLSSIDARDIGLVGKGIDSSSADLVGLAGARTTQAKSFGDDTLNVTVDSDISSVRLADNMSAKDVANAINKVDGVSGVSATTSAELVLADFVSSQGDSLTLTIAGVDITAADTTAALTATDLFTAINASTDLTALGITATNATSGEVIITRADGEDLALSAAITQTTSTDNASLTIQGLGSDGSTGVGTTQTINGVNTSTVSQNSFVSGNLDFSAAIVGENVGTLTIAADLSNSEISGSEGTLVINPSLIKRTVDTVDISSQNGSQSALEVIDAALASIDGQRADLGALQNRFDYTISNLSNIQENVSASRSRIQDTDFAVETANLTKNQILQQAGTSILAQANQLPQAALSLIG
jgi:flagellin